MINYEGGAIPEEYQVEYVADRVDTTSNVFMGLTVGCARCHDHKFDPISQKDYYRFFAFFNTVPEKGLDGRSGNAAPILEMPTAAQASEVAWLQQAIAGHEAALPEKETQPLLAAWTKTRLATLPAPPRDGLLAEYTFEEQTRRFVRQPSRRQDDPGQHALRRGAARTIGRLQWRSAAGISGLSRPNALQWRFGCAAARSAK